MAMTASSQSTTVEVIEAADSWVSPDAVSTTGMATDFEDILMNSMRTAGTAAAFTLVLLAGTPIAASAATYGGECGSGYEVVNSAPIGTLGTVFLTYNSATGKNCVVAKRHQAGSAVRMEAGLGLNPVSSHWPEYTNDMLTFYTGAIYLAAASKCVDWMGRISGVDGGRRGTSCN